MARMPSSGCALIFVILVLPVIASAQVPDSTKKDSVYALPPIEVVGSILPLPGINIGSGIAGVSTKLDWSQVDPTEPKVLPDVLRQQSGMSTYDNLGSPQDQRQHPRFLCVAGSRDAAGRLDLRRRRTRR